MSKWFFLLLIWLQNCNAQPIAPQLTWRQLLTATLVDAKYPTENLFPGPLPAIETASLQDEKGGSNSNAIFAKRLEEGQTRSEQTVAGLTSLQTNVTSRIYKLLQDKNPSSNDIKQLALLLRGMGDHFYYDVPMTYQLAHASYIALWSGDVANRGTILGIMTSITFARARKSQCIAGYSWQLANALDALASGKGKDERDKALQARMKIVDYLDYPTVAEGMTLNSGLDVVERDAYCAVRPPLPPCKGEPRSKWRAYAENTIKSLDPMAAVLLQPFPTPDAWRTAKDTYLMTVLEGRRFSDLTLGSSLACDK